MDGKRVKFYIERNSFGVQAMAILMSLSIVFRIIGCWGLWTDRNFLMLQIVLPVFSALLMIASVLLLGKRALWISFIPVLLGAVFFIIKSLGFESMLHTILCIVLYVAVIVLYFCTVFGILPTKWVLKILQHFVIRRIPSVLRRECRRWEFSASCLGCFSFLFP